MANKVLLKKSSTAAKVPLTSDLDYGELALNYNDGKLHYKKSDGTTIDHFPSAPIIAAGYVAKAGDTMTGTLNLPSNGLKVGTNQLVVYNGSIGIGTATPSWPLDVNGAVNASFFKISTSGTTANGNTMNSPVADTLAFHTNSVERLRIGSTGNVGIGTGSPATKLSVISPAGEYRQLELNCATGGQILYAGSVADTVGSYTQNNAYYSSSYQFYPIKTASSGIHYESDGSFWISTNSGLTVGTNFIPSNRLHIAATGNVGIGTNAPEVKLDVRGTTTATIRVGSTGHGGAGDEFGNLEFYWADPDSAGIKAKIYAKNVGNVGPGGGGAADLLFATMPALGSITERMRLDSVGNLGLGVTPSAWLSSSRVIQLGNGGFIEGRSNSAQVLRMGANAYLDSVGTSRYIGTGNAMSYEQYLGAHTWFTAPSGTAGNAITFTKAMELTTSSELIIDSGTGGGRLTFTPSSANNTIFSTTTGFGSYNILRYRGTQHHWLNSAGTQVMTLDASGRLLQGVTTAPSGGGISTVFNAATGGGIESAYNNNGGFALTPSAGAGLLFYTFTGAVGSETYSERARIDASGNLGLGITPSAWGSGIKSQQIGNYTALTNNQGGYTWLSNNAFYDTAWKYLTTNRALYYAQDTGDGGHKWYTAPSGTAGAAITFTQAMTLTANGNLGLSVIDPASVFEAKSSLGSIGITSSGSQGSQLYFKNTARTLTTASISNNGGSNEILAFTVTSGLSADLMSFTLGGSTKMVLNGSGNLGIGTTSPSSRLDVVGDIRVNSINVFNGSSGTTTSTTQTAVALFSTATYGSGKFIIQATQGTIRHIIELLVVHDGTTAYATEYGMIRTGASLFTTDVDISSGNVRVLVTATSATSTAYKISQNLILA